MRLRKLRNGLIVLLVLSAVGYTAYQLPAVREFVHRTSDPLLPKASGLTRFYKWRDAKGKWHLTDTPPSAGIHYETVDINPNTNVLPSEAFTGKKKP